MLKKLFLLSACLISVSSTELWATSGDVFFEGTTNKNLVRSGPTGNPTIDGYVTRIKQNPMAISTYEDNAKNSAVYTVFNTPEMLKTFAEMADGLQAYQQGQQNNAQAFTNQFPGATTTTTMTPLPNGGFRQQTNSAYNQSSNTQ